MDHTKKPGMHPRARKGQAVPASYKTPVMLFITQYVLDTIYATNTNNINIKLFSS